MQVVSIGPLPVASVLWQAAPATWVLTAVCKATFTLAPVEAKLAPAQDPIDDRDRHQDDDPSKSLVAASDLAPFKLSPEVLVVGRAFAPGGQPARTVTVRMIVGSVDKSVRVTADRSWSQQGELSEGARFTSMPLAYERAGGGPDTWNTAGIRRGARDRYGRVAVPNLTMPDQRIATPDTFVEPVGLGPIAWAWPLRREKLGRHAASWSPRKLAEGPLPDGVDRAFFNVSPLDQRLAEIRDNERLVLDHLHPEHAHLVTSLPGVRPRAFVTGRASGTQELALRCDTLVIDTDRQRVTATWRGQLALSHPEEAGRVLVALEQPGQPFPVEEMLRMRSAVPEPSTMPIDDVTRAGRPSAVIAPMGRPPPLPPRAARSPAARSPISESTIDLSNALPLAEKAPAMPFRAAGAPPAFSTPQAPPSAPSAPPVFSMPQAVPSPIAPPPMIAPASPGAPVSPWVGAAPQPGSTPAGTAAPVVAPPPPAARPAIGAVLAASHAAAAAQAAASGAPAPPAPPAEIAVEEDDEPAAEEASHDVLALVWIDRKQVPRIVRKPAWRRLLDALDEEPVDPEADDPLLTDEPAEMEDRVQVAAILDAGAAIDVEGLRASLAASARKRGKVVPPLELCDGDLVMVFDEIETLKAMVSTTTMLADGDEALSRAVANAEKFLASPGAASATAVAEGLTVRIREAFSQGKRAVTLESMNAQVERALLEQRYYQKRRVLGGSRLRALLQMPGEGAPQVVYLPVEVAEDLPLAARLRVRLIVALHLAVDERDSEKVALEAVAIGRVVDLG